MIRIPVSLADLQGSRYKTSLSKLKKNSSSRTGTPKHTALREAFAKALGYGTDAELRFVAKKIGDRYTEAPLPVADVIASVSQRIARQWNVTAEFADTVASSLGLEHFDACRAASRVYRSKSTGIRALKPAIQVPVLKAVGVQHPQDGHSVIDGMSPRMSSVSIQFGHEQVKAEANRAQALIDQLAIANQAQGAIEQFMAANSAQAAIDQFVTANQVQGAIEQFIEANSAQAVIDQFVKANQVQGAIEQFVEANSAQAVIDQFVKANQVQGAIEQFVKASSAQAVIDQYVKASQVQGAIEHFIEANSAQAVIDQFVKASQVQGAMEPFTEANSAQAVIDQFVKARHVQDAIEMSFGPTPARGAYEQFLIANPAQVAIDQLMNVGPTFQDALGGLPRTNPIQAELDRLNKTSKTG